MSQRKKARDMMMAEGHGADLAHITVRPGDKRAIVAPHSGGSPKMAECQVSHDCAEMGDDGLLHGAVGDI